MKARQRILFAEDEPFLGKVVSESLEKEGFEVVWAKDGEQASELFALQHFDICILDVMLPKSDGFTVARKIRSRNAFLPILFLTARDAVEDLKTGYASGGNDYLRKPFSLDELFLRISELLKRVERVQSIDRFTVGRLVFEPKKLRLTHQDGSQTRLSNRECELLYLLLLNRNEILDRKIALVQLWGDDNFFTARSMDVYITRLRKKLSVDAGIEIVNLRGFGYKLIG